MKDRWEHAPAPSGDPLDQLVHISRCIGADPSLVTTGGGNTSVKTEVLDFQGHTVSALFIKASGFDLKTAKRGHFTGLRLDDLLPLMRRDSMADGEMVDYLARCTLNPNDPRPSIETLLHAFLPFPCVAHSHADAIVALTNTNRGAEPLRDLFGDTVAVVEYLRPGFTLARLVAQTLRDNPRATGAVLMNHGLFTWGDTAREAYQRHIQIVSAAEDHIAQKAKGHAIFTPVAAPSLAPDQRHNAAAALAPTLRGLVSRRQPMLLHYDDSPEVIEFVSSTEGRHLSQIGPATPDHTLQTKIKPLWLDLTNPEDLAASRRELSQAVENYANDYEGWYQANTDALHPMLDPYPRVVLAPGLGLFSTGSDPRAARTAANIYRHTIDVIKSAQAVGEYTSLSDQDAYNVEYWPLELYKLTLAPPQREFSRRVALVTGAASGIGEAIARRLAAEGASVAVTDVNLEAAQSVAQEINDSLGCHRAAAFPLDVTNPEQVVQAFQSLRLTYGGLDILVSNAGIAPVGAIHELSLRDWQRAMDINATGHFLVAREAVKLMREQAMGGSLIFIGTKNVPAPGKDFGAYSASKAAEVQLARVLAIENGEFGIRVNIVNPDAIFQGSNLWSPELKEQRAKAHGITVEGLEDFYRQRNLLKETISGEDVAQAVLFLAGPRSAKTTGAMLPVDAGLRDAFPR